MAEELIVYVRHMRMARLCMSGTRVWFAARGWDWSEFLARGRPATDFIATGDPLAMRPVEAARKDSTRGQ